MYSALISVFICFDLTLFTQRKCVKVTFLNFQVLRERTSVIASFVEHPVYSNFKMYNVPVLVFFFDLPLIETASVKVNFS